MNIMIVSSVLKFFLTCQLTGHPFTERWLLGRDLTAVEIKEIPHSNLDAKGCKLRCICTTEHIHRDP